MSKNNCKQIPEDALVPQLLYVSGERSCIFLRVLHRPLAYLLANYLVIFLLFALDVSKVDTWGNNIFRIFNWKFSCEHHKDSRIGKICIELRFSLGFFIENIWENRGAHYQNISLIFSYILQHYKWMKKI